MPLDAICLTAVLEELRQSVQGGKIDKIYQPVRDELLMAVRGPKGAVKLLFSAHPGRPRVQLTTRSVENPEKPPMFCMLLRKHLLGARILELHQPPMERLVDFRLETVDELGDRTQRRLILECMGRWANLILLDAEGRILDCLRRVEGNTPEQRQVLPGLFYRMPPAPPKTDPLSLSPEGLETALSNPTGRAADQLLLDQFQGLSPLIARELAFRAESSSLMETLTDFLETVRQKRFTPYLLVRAGQSVDFTFLPILQYGPETESRRCESFSQLFDQFFAEKDHLERVRQRGQDLIQTVTSARDRAARKLNRQRQELAATAGRELLRQQGDIITSNLYQMERGQTVLQAENYYDPEGGQIAIPLDPLLSPQQNAAHYYKRYNKAKTAEAVLTVQIDKGEQELDYLNSVLELIKLAEGERDLQEIRQELAGYLRRPKKAAKREKPVTGRPMEFRSSAGLRISVGKNNSQNDRLTTKLAGKNDLWLHTQKIHGSHVILWTEGQPPDAQSLGEAAALAAWFSQARESKKVPVDYTPVKYVKKPAGARPGMVVYTTYQTAYVDPDGDLAQRLRV